MPTSSCLACCSTWRAGVRAIRRPARLTGKAGVIAQTLLLSPKRDWQVQDLAKEAGVAIGLAHRVLARLEDEGIVVAERAGGRRFRRITNPTALLDLWAEETADRPTRPLAHLLAQNSQPLVRELGAGPCPPRAAGIDRALTGAAAGSLVAPFITAVPVVEVWVASSAAPEELCTTRPGPPGARAGGPSPPGVDRVLSREHHSDYDESTTAKRWG